MRTLPLPTIRNAALRASCLVDSPGERDGCRWLCFASIITVGPQGYIGRQDKAAFLNIQVIRPKRPAVYDYMCVLGYPELSVYSCQIVWAALAKKDVAKGLEHVCGMWGYGFCTSGLAVRRRPDRSISTVSMDCKVRGGPRLLGIAKFTPRSSIIRYSVGPSLTLGVIIHRQWCPPEATSCRALSLPTCVPASFSGLRCSITRWR